MRRIAVLLPARNEEQAVAAVVEDVMAVLMRFCPDVEIQEQTRLSTWSPPSWTIYVLDGNGEDATKQIATDMGFAGPVKVLDVPIGKGNGVRAGLEQIDADYYLMLDCDGSYPAEYIPAILWHLENGADLVMGVRTLFQDGAMPRFNAWGNRFITWVANRLNHTHAGDLCTGMWGFSREVAKGLDIHSLGFTLEAEIFTKAVEHGWHIDEVAISLGPRIGQRKINRLDHLRILRYLVCRRFGWSL